MSSGTIVKVIVRKRSEEDRGLLKSEEDWGSLKGEPIEKF